MITPSEIKQKAMRLYPKLIDAWLAGETSFFPRRIPADLKLPTDIAATKRAVDAIRDGAKETLGYGYSIQWEERRSRIHGQNRFPASLQIESEGDLLRLIAKQSEFARLKVCVDRLLSKQPALNSWLTERSHWKDLLAVAEQLDDLLLVVDYFLENPLPDCFAREIPLPISTKLIEENRRLLSQWLDRLLPAQFIDFRFPPAEFDSRYGLRYARPHLLFRCLDASLQGELNLPFAELSLPVHAINRLAVPDDICVFVVENKTNLLTLPLLDRSIAVGGLGKAISLTSGIEWFSTSSLSYWGDLDVEGFEILAQFRRLFPQTESHLMDWSTLETYRKFAVAWDHSLGDEPSDLTAEELRVYRELRDSKIRIEQERIPHAAVVSSLARLRNCSELDS